MSELLKCPFCESDARIDVTPKAFHPSVMLYFPRCTNGSDNGINDEFNQNCVGNQGWVGFLSREEAIRAWNTREGE